MTLLNTSTKSNYKEYNLHTISKYKTVLMGIAICMVVFHHLTIRTYAGVLGKGYAFLRVTGAMGVDIFLFLSAIGLYYSYTNRKKGFYVRRFKRILPTYFVIVTPFYFYCNFAQGRLSLFFIKNFIEDITLFNYFRKGEGDWYIAAILIFYILFPIIYKASSGKVGWWMCWSLWIFLVIVIYINFPKLFSNIENFLPRIPVFLCGVRMAPLIYNKKTLDNKRIFYSICIFVVSLLLQAVFCLQGRDVAYSFWPRFWYLPLAITFCIISTYLFDRIATFELSAFSVIFTRLGTITLEMYLFNSRIIRVATLLFEQVFYGRLSELVVVVLGNIVGVLITVLLSVIVHSVMSRVLSSKSKTIKKW